MKPTMLLQKRPVSVSCSTILLFAMKKASLIALALFALGTAHSQAQTPAATRTEIPLTVDGKEVKITGPKGFKVEAREGGGIILKFRNDGKSRASMALEFTLPQPVKANSMGFELRQAQTERLVGSIVLENGKKMSKALEAMGPELFPYTIDLNTLATDSKIELDSPVKSVKISFRIAPDSGDRQVEIKSWWLE